MRGCASQSLHIAKAASTMGECEDVCGYGISELPYISGIHVGFLMSSHVADDLKSFFLF